MAILSFGKQRFRLRAVPGLHSVQVDVEGASPLAVLKRIEQLVKLVCEQCMGSLQYLTALPLDDTFDASEGREGKLVPLTIVRECIETFAPLTGRLGLTLLKPDEVQKRFGAFVQQQGLLKSYDVFISYRHSSSSLSTSGDSAVADALFDMSTNYTIGTKLRELRVYLDIARMQSGVQLATQAANALYSSLVVVPLISDACLKRMLSHEASTIDWVLFELVMALVCVGSPRSRMQKVFAVVSAKPETLAALPTTVPTATLEKANVQLKRLGMELDKRLRTATVKSLVDDVCDMIHIPVKAGVEEIDIAAEAIERVVDELR